MCLFLLSHFNGLCPSRGSPAVRTCFLIEANLGGFSYSSLVVPSNCSWLILVCHFLCLFRANSKPWIGWQTEETSWHWAVRVMPSHLLLWSFQAGKRWAEVKKKKNKKPITNPGICLLPHPEFPRSWYQFSKHKIILENMSGEVRNSQWEAACK